MTWLLNAARAITNYLINAFIRFFILQKYVILEQINFGNGRKMKQNKKLILDILPEITGVANTIKLYIKTDKDPYNLIHSHNFYEFTFISRGKIINFCNGEKVVLSKNDIMILRPECEHQIQQLPDTSYLYFNLEVNIDFLKELLKQLSVNNIDELFEDDINYIHGSENDSEELIRLVNLSQKVTATPEEQQFYLRLIVMKLLIKFVTTRDLSNNINSVNNSVVINKVLTALNNPDNFTYNLKDICEQLGYSHEYVIRRFKNANLTSPNKIFLRNKMIYAGTLLTTSNMKVINIAELCGIYTTYYFYKSFKNEFGVSPTEYRKKNQISIP